MTTKYKIICGFLLMVLLSGGLAFLGYFDLQKASDGFREYSRLANLNVGTSDLATDMYKASYNMYRFVESVNPQFMDEARKSVAEALKVLQEAREFVIKPERRTILASMEKDIQAFRGQVDGVQRDISDAYNQYVNVVQPSAVELTKGMAGIARQAREAKNLDALFAVAYAWNDLGEVRSTLSRFAGTRSQTDAERVRETLKKAEASLKEVESFLVTAEGRRFFADAARAFAAYNDAFARMDALGAEYRKNTAEMSAVLQRLLETSTKLSDDVNAEMFAFGAAMLQKNADGQRNMLIVSAIGLLIGVFSAAFIVYGIIRVLKDLAGFAGAVSQGDFGYQLHIREKGEIGVMIEAMQKIPLVLGRVIEQANVLANAILCGHFRERLDTASFSGSYANLAKAVNTVSEAYTGAIDSLPIPLMACDKNHKVLFLNSAGQKVIGGNYTETQCSNNLKAEECGSSKCFGTCAMTQDSPYSGETTVYPHGKRMDVAVTAIPLHDIHKATAGFLEILTDLTEVKSKQAVMLKVATDASEISDRVAAASEELAAQVEQISRGAEMQRSRVESTASAMAEMNSTVLEVARNAGRASEQSEGTRVKAEEGAGLVNKVVNSINSVNKVAITLQDNMQELGKQAESIGGVMNVISDIADQTNLLALNAAIEAARAGEAGRGFAVVADEVRKLAEKTMQATQEVGSSINAIQGSARTNISEVGNAVKSINEATSLANSSGAALKEIVDLASANSSVVASIATAAEEQSATSEEINKAVDEINRVVGETTDGMVQSSSAVQDLSHMAQELRRVMEGLK